MADAARVRVWAEALFRMHLEPTFGVGKWTFAFDNAKRRAGLCNYTDHRISVSRYLSARFEDDEIHQILLHEVAHALAGPEAGHGAKWKRIAAEIGYEGGRTHDGDVARELAPWVGHCPAGHEHLRFRSPTRQTSCGSCTKGFSKAHLIRWEKR